MSRGDSHILNVALAGFAAQEAELAATAARQATAVVTRTASGTEDIDAAFALDRKFRLVFIRGHFAGGTGTASLTISADSAAGTAYDTRLFTITKAGVGRDLNLRIPSDQTTEPAPWTFQAGDSVRVQWSNPDTGNITWGLEVGLAIAT